ncbi:ATP-binding protein [Halioglobus sp. HI00S01]|uniref:ATP-binding protein n=1 Tax=Halioglobus sp. HI00S01 TaxID=1822214 RepID=UPI0009EE8159
MCDSRDQEGHGLGLKMVQRFASDAGGGVRIVSTPGKGTDVTILLPAAAGPQAR